MIKKAILVGVFMFLVCIVQAQIFKVPKEKAVEIKLDKLVYKFHVLIKKKEINLDNGTYYHWFKDGKIQKNQGGYSGQLLEGVYKVYSRHGALLERGRYSRGVKDGEWKKWDKSGKLLEESHWKKGLKHGLFSNYSTGEKVSRKYKNGKLKKKRTLKNLFRRRKKEVSNEKKA